MWSKDVFLVFSNLVYVLPIVMLLVKMYTEQGRGMNKHSGFALVAVFLFITFVSSWSFHGCRTEHIVDERPHNIPPESKCRHNCPLSHVYRLYGSENETTYQLVTFIDHLMALSAILLVFMQVVPVRPEMRTLLYILSQIWFVTLLATGNEKLTLVPVAGAFVLFLGFWFHAKHGLDPRVRRKRHYSWVAAFLSFMVAFFFFEVHQEPYWINHSLWHIFSSLGATFVIYGASESYQFIHLQDTPNSALFKVFFQDIPPPRRRRSSENIQHRTL
jgi:hypothetical protein